MRFPWVTRERMEAAERRAQIAEDRLYAAWKDGYTIPPRQSVIPAEPKVIELLPAKLTTFVENWEDPLVRQELEAEARRMHFDLGMPEDRVLEYFQKRNGDTPI